MTETQAKSGNKGASANPVDEEAAQGSTPASGRAAVGRATVPADAPAPKFTRAPGMTPPPDKPAEDAGTAEKAEKAPVVATSVLYLALDAMGVFTSVNSSLTDLVNAGGGTGSGGGFQITAKGVILSSALIGLVNVVLFTALATLGAFVYNVCADLVGGI